MKLQQTPTIPGGIAGPKQLLIRRGWKLTGIILLCLAAWSIFWGCSASPKEGQFSCESDADCPSDWMCNILGDGKCYSNTEDILTDTESDTNTETEPTSDDSPSTDDSDTSTDSETDSSTDTGTDTNTDTSTDTDTGTDSDTDTGTDTGTDSDNDTGIDTGTDSDNDTGTDTDMDSDTDTGTDTGTDTETDIDTGTDTDTGTDIGPIGDSCTHPELIDSFTTTWQGVWSDYTNTFFPVIPADCGDVGTDVWFAVTVPANDSVLVRETSGADVILQLVDSCADTTCTDFSDNPEQYRLDNNLSEPQDFYIIVTEAPGNTVDEVIVEFFL
ncbi:MAG: hypothetical protein JXR45_23250 [Deltaproteobacteria bacterium]|nr:hypothetical protein [Deltaproteobacteria bacterium]